MPERLQPLDVRVIRSVLRCTVLPDLVETLNQPFLRDQAARVLEKLDALYDPVTDRAYANTNEYVLQREEDGRWLAVIAGTPGVMAYGVGPAEAIQNVQRLHAKLKLIG